MSFVLILSSGYAGAPPAILAGYRSINDAERAGDAASAFEEATDERPWWAIGLPYFTRYTIIPSLDEASFASVHCVVERPEGNQIVRTKRRFE